MSHVIKPNVVLNNDSFLAVWWLTRSMQKAGWQYRGSGNGGTVATTVAAGSNNANLAVVTTINVASTSGFASSGTITIMSSLGAQVVSYTGTTGTSFTGCSGGVGTIITGATINLRDVTANPSNNRWAVLATQTGNNSGAAASITSGAAYGVGQLGNQYAVVTGVSGLIAQDTGSGTWNNGGSVGNYLRFTNAATAANNGTWHIVSVISSTSCVIYNPNGSFTFPDANNGSLTWTEWNPMNDVYNTPALGSGAWINLRGPSTIRIPIGANVPTGTFLRGEPLTQTTTGAKGQLEGIFIDPVTSFGYMVVTPRFDGSGSGARGWSGTTPALITGDWSQATITPSNSAAEYCREVVFWRDSTINGHMYYAVWLNASTTIAAGSAGANFPGNGGSSTIQVASLNGFLVPPLSSTTANNVIYIQDSNGVYIPITYTGIQTSPPAFTGCTGTGGSGVIGSAGWAVVDRETYWSPSFMSRNNIGSTTSTQTTVVAVSDVTPPYGGSAGNTANQNTSATVVYTMCGQISPSGGTVSNGSARWETTNQTSSMVRGNSVACHAFVDGSSTSPDASFYCLISTPNVSAGCYSGFLFSRLDDQEDADCDPYIFFRNGNFPAQAGPTANSAGGQTNIFISQYTEGTNHWPYYGTYAKGVHGVQGFSAYASFSNLCWQTNSQTYYSWNGYTSIDAVVANPTATQIKVLAPLWATTAFNNPRHKKGTFRWWYGIQIASGSDTLQNKELIVLTTTSLAGGGYTLAIGPWDRTTTPTTS